MLEHHDELFFIEIAGCDLHDLIFFADGTLEVNGLIATDTINSAPSRAPGKEIVPAPDNPSKVSLQYLSASPSNCTNRLVKASGGWPMALGLSYQYVSSIPAAVLAVTWMGVSPVQS